ncbi:MAG: hypothetical protein IKB98_04920, partial [Clostridia bacterium]|nr:hypothetical protein [Clostridia bacterium]
VHTTLNKTQQKTIENIFNNLSTDTNQTICIQNNLGQIKAYISNCGEINRQPGSTLKPLAVYLPAIELGTVDSCSKINDEKTVINGYCPNNYADIYYGNISVKQSLAKSSNVCAVKLLNMVGCKKSIEYLKKTDLGFNENDANLSLALGATRYGVKLSNLIASYNIFMNDGYYFSPYTIELIKDKNGRTLYNQKTKKNRVFADETTEIVREMLKNTVENGTAKKLYSPDRSLYAKTGTVGNEKGNTDAYTISFNKEYILGVWLGAKQNKYMENTITGGGLPCQISNIVWNNLYYKKSFPQDFEINKAQKVLIDKISYEEEGKVFRSDILADDSNSICELFTYKRVPKKTSTRFSSPTIKNVNISVNSSEIRLRLCVTDYVNYIIYNTEENNKYKLYDSISCKNKDTVILKNIKSNHVYNLSILPYFTKDDNIYYGKELVLKKIKTPTTSIGDEWWDNE